MLRDRLTQIVTSAVEALVTAGTLPATVREAAVEISDTKTPEHGDFACNVAMVASKRAGMNPRALGEALRDAIMGADPLVSAVEVAGPGFLNFRLDPAEVARYVGEVLANGEDYARLEAAKPQKINVEFVSVNPNGPITIGSGRGAAYGSTLCNVFEAAGHQVHREYYINDGVNSEQMRLFAESIRAILRGTKIPSRGYKGDYVHLAALEVVPRLEGRTSRNPKEEARRKEQEFLATFLEDYMDVTGLTFKSLYLTVRAVHDQPFLLELMNPRAKHFVERLIRVVNFNFQEQGHGETVDDLTFLKLLGVTVFSLERDSQGVKPEFYVLGRFKQDVKAYNRWRDVQLKDIDRKSLSLDAATALLLNAYEGLFEALVDLHNLRIRFLAKTGKVAVKNKKLTTIQSAAQAVMIEQQKRSLEAFGVKFDTWFSEQSLHESGAVSVVLGELLQKGVADEEPVRTKLKMGRGGIVEDVEREAQSGQAADDEEGEGTGEGATLWLRSTKFGDDMDRVLRRKDGRLTYIASDVAYHFDKLHDSSGTRGSGPVDRMITILGPDHHGYIARLQAVVAALLMTPQEDEGDALSDTDGQIYRTASERDACRAALAEAKQKLEVQIYQLVRFLKDGKPAPMRKRDGNIYAILDLIREIGERVKPNGTEEEKLTAGRDVARFFYLMRSHDTTFDFDLDLAEKQSDDNPVFYVQYAHARICSVLRKAGEAGLSREGFDPTLLTHERETALLKKVLDLPDEIRRCAEDYGVHRLATYAIELARTYHHFYDACRVIQADQPELSKARLALCEAAAIGLRAALGLLGVSAPERMERTEA